VTALYLLLWLHLIGAAVLLGTGAGIAFFMVMAHRTADAGVIAHTASVVVVADYLFTATAVVLQPITGLWLAHLMGWPWTQGWILGSIGLFLLTGICWLPVVWMQTRMRFLARQAVARGEELPREYHVLFRRWAVLGIPAFVSVLAILWLMAAKPTVAFID
jgi:uncharacterized membrane protein